MDSGLVYIELRTTRLGEDVKISNYLSPVVPRKNETIHLRLHAGYSAIKPGEQARAHSASFYVRDIEYIVFNLYPSEQWFTPWPEGKISDYVVIDVGPTNDEARDYIQRLAEAAQAEREKQQ